MALVTTTHPAKAVAWFEHCVMANISVTVAYAASSSPGETGLRRLTANVMDSLPPRAGSQLSLTLSLK
ncbi:hypothetical protein GCM10010151_69000 [Actinoallomurus spadix]|uniref:Uncharacterized protein n=1 Tax=Actinoallomurus spadix TaxID=79912 RepID=A0ABP3HJ55_9ACTN